MRRRKKKKKRLFAGAAAAVVIAAAGTTLVYWNLPQTRAGRKLDQALEYMTAMEYVQAEEVYSEALSIDEGSVRAYRGLADDYLAQGRREEAEDVLRKGYEVTGAEVLLQNYCATVLNRVVEEVNNGTADLTSIGRCLDVLEQDAGNQDALSLLSVCAQRILQKDGSSSVMLDGMDGSVTFSQYQVLTDRVFALAQKNSAAFGTAAAQFALTQASEVYLSLSHVQEYREILERAQQLDVAGADEMLACLEKQEEVSAFFASMFEAFEAADYEAAKEFIITEEYEAIRDAFIDGTMEYWEGSTYTPVTKEAVVLLHTEEGWKFSYVENDRIAQPSGTIRVLGQKMKDLGVQRSSIEYVPPYEPGQYYPHTEYEIVYWNTMVSGIATDNTNVVSRMNYRFAEKIYTADGMEANMIYDWGGANEKRQKE